MIRNSKIYDSSIRAGNTTYFFDLLKSSHGNIFLEITESEKIGKGEFIRNRIKINEEDLKQFKNEVQEVYEKLLSLI